MPTRRCRGSDIGIGKTRWELPHLEPEEEAWRKHRETLDAHLPFRDFELARPRPNGGRRYWSVSGLPVFDETGRFVGYRGLGRHITERKRVEERLRESEQRYRNIFETAGVSIWEEDFSEVKAAIESLKAQGVRDFRQYIAAHPEFVRQAVAMVKIVDVNDATVKLFGATSKEDLLGSLQTIFTPETEKVFAEELVAIAEERSSFASETSLRTLTGEKLAVVFTMTFPPQPTSLEGVLVTVMDITERKQAENLTAQFFESAPDGVCIVERDYRYRRANPIYARRWGMPAERIVGMHVADLLGVDSFERTLKPNLDRCFAGEEVLFDWSSESSPRRYFAVSYSPLRSGSEDVEAALVIQRDVTDRKEAELALRESEQRFRDYAEIASDWFWESDSEHRFTSFTRSAATGGFVRDFIGKRRWELAADREEEPEKWRAHISTLEAHEPFRSFRYRASRPDGSAIYLSVGGDHHRRAVLVRSAHHQDVVSLEPVVARVDVPRDGEPDHVPEMSRAARVRPGGRDEDLPGLLLRQGERMLCAACDQTELRDRAQLGVYLRLLDVPDLAEAREALSCIISDANRAADVIARIRALTRKTPFQKQQVDLNDVVREVAGLTRTEMDRNRVELRTQLADDLPPVQADRIELQQLVLNLIVNAIEAMSDGARRDLLIASKKDDANNVRVSVCDSGRGLDPAAADRIFQPFYTTKHGGMGMGLAICRSILERLGGRLSVRANAPCGTIFEFSIPIEQADASAEWPVPAASSGPQQP